MLYTIAQARRGASRGGKLSSERFVVLLSMYFKVSPHPPVMLERLPLFAAENVAAALNFSRHARHADACGMNRKAPEEDCCEPEQEQDAQRGAAASGMEQSDGSPPGSPRPPRCAPEVRV